MEQHTPGPWHYSGVPGLPRVRLGPDKDKTLGLLIADCQNCYLPEGQAKANARLIAAAPDLLWTLNDILSFLKSHGYDTRLVEAAIAKATQ